MEKVWKPVPDVEELKYHGTPEKPDIKIFVSHRIDLDSETIDNPLYIPVRCGAVYDERENVTMLGDDTGDNISDRKFTYGNLTLQYWAWKNIKADYYGIGSYNQYLSFSENKYKESAEGLVIDPALRNSSIKNKYLSKVFTEIGSSTLGIYYIHIPILTLFSIYLYRYIYFKGVFINTIKSILVILISYVIIRIIRKIPILKKIVI